MARVYILVNVMPGGTGQSGIPLRKIKGVAAADVITGHYDIAAVLESENMGASLTHPQEG